MLHRSIRLFFLAAVAALCLVASAAFAATQLEIRQADIASYTIATDDATRAVYVKDNSLKVNPGVLIDTYSSLVIRNVVLSGDFLVQASMPAGLTISLIGCTFTNADITGVSVGAQLSIATSTLNYINVATALGGTLSVSDSTLTSLASSSGWYLLRLTGGMANGSSFSMARCNASLTGTGINGGPVDLGDVSGATVSMSANIFSSAGDVATTQRVGINIGAISGNSNVTIASHTIDATMSSDIHCIYVSSWASTGTFTLTGLTCTATAVEFYGQTTAGVTIRGADATGLVLLEGNTITATAFESDATAVSFNPITALATTMTLSQVVLRSNVLVAESRDAAAVGVSVGLIPAVTVTAIDILYGSITATTTSGTANALLLPSNGGTGIALTLAQGTFSVSGDAGSATSAVMIAVPAVSGAAAWPNSPIVITGSTFLAGSTGAVMMQNVKLSLATSSIMARCSLWKGALLVASDLDAAAVINIATCGNVSTTALDSCSYSYDCNPVTTRRAVLKSGLCYCACRGDTSVLAWYPRTLQCAGSLGVGLASRTMTEPMIPLEDLSGSRISVYAALLVATMLWMVVLCAFVIGSCLLCGFGVGCCKHFGARAVRHSGARRQYRPGTLQRRHKVIADARDVEAKALRDAGHEQDAVMLLAMPMPSAAQQTAGVAATFHSFERERSVSAFINEMGSALKLFFGCGSHAAICEDDMDSVHSGVTSDDPSIAGLEETGDADRPAGPAPLAPSVRQTLVLNWVQDQDLGPEIRGYAAVEGAGYTTARHVMSPEGRPVGRGEMFSPKPGTGTGAVATTYAQDDIRSIVQTVLRDEDVRSVLGGFGGATRSVHSVDASFTSHAGGAGVSGAAGGDANAERLRVQMRDLQKGTATSMAALQRLVKDMSEQQLRRFDELQHNIAMTANSPVARPGPGTVANTPASAAAAGLSDEQMQTLAKIVESTVQRALAAQRATSSASAASVPSPAQQRLAVVASEPTDARAWTSRSGPNSSRVPATTTTSAAVAPNSSRSHPHEPFTYHARAAAHAGRSGGAGSSDSEDYDPVETTALRSAAPFGDDDMGGVGSIQPQSQRGTVGASAPASSLGVAPSAQPGASRLAIPLVATDPQQQHADGDTPRGPTSGRARGPVPMSQGSPFGNGARGRR